MYPKAVYQFKQCQLWEWFKQCKQFIARSYLHLWFLYLTCRRPNNKGGPNISKRNRVPLFTSRVYSPSSLLMTSIVHLSQRHFTLQHICILGEKYFCFPALDATSPAFWLLCAGKPNQWKVPNAFYKAVLYFLAFFLAINIQNLGSGVAKLDFWKILRFHIISTMACQRQVHGEQN